MSYAIAYASGVERDMARLPVSLLRRVDKAILALAINPRPPGYKRLVGISVLWRVRVGD
jgi:mRNA interferase RelE/StbE